MADLAFKDLPKVELHTHLDCGLSYRAVRQLSPSVSLEEFQARYKAPRRCKDLATYLTYIDPSLDLLQTAAALRLAAADMAEQLADDNVVYAEVRFAPLLHRRNGLAPEAVVEAVLEGFAASTVPVGVLLCSLRHFTTEEGFETLSLVERYRGKGVVGLDLAGDEKTYPLDPQVPVFARARELGLPYTIHAGEARGADSVIEVIEKLAPPRIGHGVRSAEDPRAMDMIRARRIHLEVCPSVNLQIGLFPEAAAHSIDMLRRAGLSVGVNTDARTVVGVTLTHEYELLARAFGWTTDDFVRCNRDALNAAFAPESLKAAILPALTPAPRRSRGNGG